MPSGNTPTLYRFPKVEDLKDPQPTWSSNLQTLKEQAGSLLERSGPYQESGYPEIDDAATKLQGWYWDAAKKLNKVLEPGKTVSVREGKTLCGNLWAAVNNAQKGQQ